jgi:translation initiation factor 2 alpha subunit (eIF-2alpha)
MSSNQFYSVINPSVGECVLVHFIKRTDTFFDAILLEYPYRAMMSYQDATKKRKIYNWNKIVPLNKDMVARVDDVDEQSKIVQVSISHLDEEFEESLSLSEIQEKLMITFNENKLLYNFISSIAVVNKINKNDLWTKLIYYIDSQRRQLDEEITLWKYFSNNFHNIDEWCKTVNIYDTILSESIKEIYAKRFTNKFKYVSKIGIISPNGINITKNILDKVLTPFSELGYKYTFNYDGTPYYLFETFSDETTKDDHEKLVEELKQNTDIFIKIDYIAKEIKL